MPKIVDVQQYRQELLSKCFDLFAQKGYANVTTRQIAKELGVSTGTLYHYFPNKQVLFEQLAEQICLQDVELIDRVDKNQTIPQRITALGQLLIENQEYVVKQAVIWFDFCQHCLAKDIDYSRILQQVNSSYEKAISNLLDLENPRLASFIWTLVDGISINQIDNETNFATEIELLSEMLIAYFEKHILT